MRLASEVHPLCMYRRSTRASVLKLWARASMPKTCPTQSDGGQDLLGESQTVGGLHSQSPIELTGRRRRRWDRLAYNLGHKSDKFFATLNGILCETSRLAWSPGTLAQAGKAEPICSGDRAGEAQRRQMWDKCYHQC